MQEDPAQELLDGVYMTDLVMRSGQIVLYTYFVQCIVQHMSKIQRALGPVREIYSSCVCVISR